MSNRANIILNILIFFGMLCLCFWINQRIGQYEKGLNDLNLAVKTDYINRSSPIRTQIDEFREKRRKLSELNNELYQSSDKYFSMLIELKSNNSKDNQDKLEQLNKVLDDNLSRAEVEFGLITTKFIRLFEIAKYNNYKNLFSSSKKDKFNNEMSLLSLFEKLTDAEKADIDSFDIFITKVLLDDGKIYSPHDDIIKKISASIDDKLIQSDIEKLKKNRLNISNCVTSFFERENSYSEDVAMTIAELQYQSRYCPNLIGTISKEDCFASQYSSPSDSRREFCAIVSSRIEQESTQASDKYGSLSFSDYFEKYVAPLVEQNVSAFKKSSDIDKNMYCHMNLLPIVKFRDPTVDAYLAAYLKIAPEFCKDKLFL